MIKIFKWYLVDYYDLKCYVRGETKQQEKIIEKIERDLWEKNILIAKLEEENIKLKSLLDKKIIREIGEPVEYNGFDILRGKDNE